MGSHQVTLGPEIYIEQNDFKKVGEKGYRRLTPDQPVGLRYASLVLKAINTKKRVPVEDVEVKPKAFIHWVANPLEIEVRLYERLFKHRNPEDPNEVPGGFLTDVNKDSLKIVKAVADDSIVMGRKLKVYDKFQFELQGFFCRSRFRCRKQEVGVQPLKEDSGK